MKRTVSLLLVLVAVAATFVISQQTELTVGEKAFRGRFFMLLHGHGFITDVSLELRGPKDTPSVAIDAATSIPISMWLNPSRPHPLHVPGEWRRNYRLAHRNSDSTFLCSVIFLDDRACGILLGAQPEAMADASFLQALLVREFPTLPVRLQPCASSKAVQARDNPGTPTSVTNPSAVLAEKPQYASLTPDLAGLRGDIRIRFTVKNISTENIVFQQDWENPVHLMTFDEAGNKVSVQYFRRLDHSLIGGGGPRPRQNVLKPGESETCEAGYCPMEAVIFLADRKREIFGEFTGHIAGTSRPFFAYSSPFPIPPQLLNLSWEPWATNDNGDESYGWLPH